MSITFTDLSFRRQPHAGSAFTTQCWASARVSNGVGLYPAVCGLCAIVAMQQFAANLSGQFLRPGRWSMPTTTRFLFFEGASSVWHDLQGILGNRRRAAVARSTPLERDEPDHPVALHECRPTQADAEEAAEGRAVQAVTGRIIVALLCRIVTAENSA